ncbi:MAG TPA: Swt1 family HEPN domain-containing protein [Rhizobiaceae bacterium]|nr:Swt1 family HEPN domain-containing protein [Rhizobiaceae bacterium]
MNIDRDVALFVMLGQTAERAINRLEDVVPSESLYLSSAYDLATVLPEGVRSASKASEAYKLLFVFEKYLRQLTVEVLAGDGSANWWDLVPPDVQSEVKRLEETEETKSWMALGSRDKSALMTLPQLLKVIEHNWKGAFEDVIRDRGLIQEARLLIHLRNTICHMSAIPEEELARVRQTMRDWFRVVAP